MGYQILYGNGCSFMEGSELGNIEFRYDEARFGPNTSKSILQNKGDQNSQDHLRHMQETCCVNQLANQLNIPEVINDALGGSSNYRITRTTIEQLTELLKTYQAKDILVVVGWTGITRYEIRNGDQYTCLSIDDDSKILLDRELMKFAVARNNTIPLMLTDILYDFFRNVITLKQFLEQNEIKYLFFLSFKDMITQTWDNDQIKHTKGDPSLDSFFQVMEFNNWARGPNIGTNQETVSDFIAMHKCSFDSHAKINGFPFGNGSHPLEEAHKAWALYLKDFITERGLL